jgi:hypothetical protein
MLNQVKLGNSIKKGLEQYDFLKIGKSKCKNEEQSKQFLILPFMSLLGYSHLDLTPEYIADFGGRKGKKVDYAIQIDSKEPVIIIECKKYGEALDRHTSQLNQYFINTDSSKIGVLTNGIEYRFYVSEKKKPLLNSSPFFVFEIGDIDSSALSRLASFHKKIIDVKSILDEANQILLAQQFEEALYEELKNPSKEFIGSVYKKMGIGQRCSPQMTNEISNMIDVHSLKDAYDRILADEVASGRTGVITTKEELQSYHIIRTMLIQARGITSDRISYRDLRKSFSILIDDNQRKCICSLIINSKKKEVNIDGEKVLFKNIDDLLKLKKQLVKRALKLIDE